MADENTRARPIRQDVDLAQMISQMARSVSVDVVVCGTETGSLVRHVREMDNDLRIVAATPKRETQEALVRDGFEVLRLPVRVANKYNQARHAVAMALNASKVSPGDLVLCAVGHNLCRGDADLILVTDVEASAADVALSELVKLTEGIRPGLLEAAFQVACKIGRVSRRGKRLGALFVLGDSDNILKGVKQLILNPFQGHEDADRMLTNADIDEMLIELAKLDGAFIVREDGLIRTAGAFLAAPEINVELPPGLGSRHVAAAAVTAGTAATAVVVSSTDGYVRVFSGGELVLQMDPDVPLAPLPRDTSS